MVTSLVSIPATAEVHNFKIVDVQGQPRCAPGESKLDEDVDRLKVVVEFPTDAHPSVKDLTLEVRGSTPTISVDGNVVTGVLEPPSYQPGLEYQVTATYKTQSLPCHSARTATTATTKDEVSADVEAQKWLLSHAGVAARELLEANIRFNKGVTLLYHLPSGAVAAPFPESVAEHDTLQAVVVFKRELEGAVTLDIQSCGERDSLRVLGGPASGQEQGKGTAPVTDPFELIPARQSFKCGAGKLIYAAGQVASGSTRGPSTTILRVRPVYQLAATFMWGFDFLKQSSFALQDGKITRLDDKTGPSLNFGFTWFPGGVDYENMKGRNYWLNPFLVFDLKAPKENFATGLALTRSGNLYFAVGASFHKVKVLNGVVEGAPFAGEGDIPTRSVWNKNSIGFFFAVGLDAGSFAKLKGLVPSGK